MWVHITSKLLGSNPIVLFCYELTRGTDHLRKFYEDFKGFITCDAYCSYRVLEKENQNIICVCGCMMHLRRRYTQSLALIDKTKITDAQILELPETKALVMIGKIYDADEALKSLPAKERLEQRIAVVRPLVDEYYEFVDGFDTSSPFIGSHFKDALNYSKNQKEFLSRFLTDGNIPIDNGATERSIRQFAIGRNNFMHCNTIDGAEAVAIMYSLVETARANGANVYYFLKYILEQMPLHMEDKDTGFLKTMVPWSDEYKEYERINTCGKTSDAPPGIFTSKPRTPKKGEASGVPPPEDVA